MKLRAACAGLLLVVAATSAGCGALSLDGRVENGTYTSSDGRFSVQVPHPDDTDEQQHQDIQEVHGDGEEFVFFGPTDTDQRVFRLNISWWPAGVPRSKTFEAVAPAFLSRYIGHLKDYGANPTMLNSGTDTFGGRRAFRWELEQVVAAGVVLSNRAATMRHEIWAIDTEHAVAMVCVQWYLDPPDHRDSVAEARRFAESVVVR